MGRNGGKKTGGRVKGSVNKTTQLLFDLVEEKELGPIEGLRQCMIELQNLVAYDEATKLSIIKAKADIFMEVMTYMYPKRKAIEHTIPPDSKLNRIIKVEWADQDANSYSEDEEANASSNSDQ